MSFVANKNSQCHFCGKTVYAMEKMDADGKTFHKACFKCEHCQCVLKLGNFAAMGGRYFCKPHFKQLFKEKGNYHSGFGNEDAKSKWAPQAVVYGAPGANFMKASASEWDSRQTQSFRMPRPRAETDITGSAKVSTLTFSPALPKPTAPVAAEVSSAPSSPAPEAAASSPLSTSPPQSNSAPTSPAPVAAKGGDFKPPRESLAQLASVGALKSVGERWAGTGPAGDASRDQRRRAALGARKAPVAEEKAQSPAPVAAAAEKAPVAEEKAQSPAPVAEPEKVEAKEEPAVATTASHTPDESKSIDELKAELEQQRSKFASEKAAFDQAKQQFEDEKKAFEEQRQAFDEQKKVFQNERKQWAETHPDETPAAAAEVQA